MEERSEGGEDTPGAAGAEGPRAVRWMQRGRPPFGRILGLLVLAFVILCVGWWMVGRMTADSRRLEIRRVAESATMDGPRGAEQPAGLREPADPGGSGDSGNPESGISAEEEAAGAPIRVLTWNIAHGRGDVGPGLLRNFRGGDEETRLLRLVRIARVIRDADPDVVVLNEVDFQSSWSGGINQAEILARATGFDVWVEQRNYDLQLPFAVLEFGNALLSSIPVDTAVWVDIPPHRWIEAVTVGAKAASLVRLGGRVGPLSVIPVHLEVRGVETRLGAAAVFQGLREGEPAPLIVAGDFNSAPPTWPQTGNRAGMASVERSAVGELLDDGWRSFRARRGPGPEQWTYPVPRADRAIDWVLVEPPLQVLEARVVEGTLGLSDHAPVLAVVRVSHSPDA